MVFIRPKILRDGVQTAIETNSKYNYMRDIQLRGGNATGGQPVLPPIDEQIAPSAPAPIDLRELGEDTEGEP